MEVMGMAVDVKPVLVIAGEVVEVTAKTYTDRDSGEVTDKGRVAVVKTAKGFIEMKLPVRQSDVAIASGDRGAWFVVPFEWGFLRGQGAEASVRYGVSYVYEDAMPAAVFDAIAKAVDRVPVGA